MIIRRAQLKDLAAITAIYNESILNDVATFDTDPKTEQQQTLWFKQFGDRYPLLVAEVDGKVGGWACLKAWSDRLAYAATVENSLYVDPLYQGRGLGRALLQASIEAGQSSNFHTIVARITEGNKVSVKLHEDLGFRHIGIMKECGEKFGRLLDVYLMQFIYADRA